MIATIVVGSAVGETVVVDRTAVVLGLLAALGVGLAARTIVRPRRRLAPRLDPYLGAAPLPWWEPGAIDSAAVTDAIGGSPSRGVAARWATVVATTRRRLQRGWVDRVVAAGLHPHEAPALRRRQIRTGLAGGALGVALGLSLFGPGPGALLFAGLVVITASTRVPGRVARLRAERQVALEADTPRVAELVAVQLRAGHGLAEALWRAVEGRPGPLAAEFATTAATIASGVGAAEAWAALGRRLPDPGAARLCRTLSASARSGGDLAPLLLSQASDLRALRRHAVARRAVRRRTAMVAPLLVCIAPVMALFVAAALPSLVLGR